MRALALPKISWPGTGAHKPGRPGGGFQLMRYVVLTSLVALAFFMFLMYFTEHLEESFFEEVQHDQLTFFEEVQTGFMREHDLSRQSEILKVHEAGHLNLAHVFANMLWEGTLSPFVKRAQDIPFEQCRAQAGEPGVPGAAATPSPQQQACIAKVRQAIVALPHFAELDATVRATMHKSSVFKVKVFDLRGLTVYSSEQAQVGEDKAANQGWKAAASGHAASELTHRARFSAFEGVVEDRDLISSYIPVMTEQQQVQGVFEIYSDATPFLKAAEEGSAAMARHIADNRTTANFVARKNLERITTNNGYAQTISVILFGLFYSALLLIVFNGQRILDQHVLAEEQAGERERLWYREKMTALATMAANVSHEVGNPLATISALAQDMECEKRQHGCTGCRPEIILEQTHRIATLTRQIVSFATVRDKGPEPVDVNQMVVAVCDFLGFDHRFRAVHIETRLGRNLPARFLIPDHLNEALMLALQRSLEKNLQRAAAPRRIVVQTQMERQDLLLRIDFDVSPTPAGPTSPDPAPDPLPDHSLDLASRRLREIGGRLSALPSAIEIRLSAPGPGDASHVG